MESECKLREYHRLVKIRKMLTSTEQKMANRIRLFHAATQKIAKKRQNQSRLLQRIDNIKADCAKADCQLPTPVPARRKSADLSHPSEGKARAGRISQERACNARLVKEDKERFKVLIQERKKFQMQRKTQSATMVRKTRENIRAVQEEWRMERQKRAGQNLGQKYRVEQQSIGELERHLKELEIKEKEALMEWKVMIDQAGE